MTNDASQFSRFWGDLYRGFSVYLFTYWGTVLYYDTEKQELRHGPIDRHASNVKLVTCGTPAEPAVSAILVVEASGEFLAVACGPDSSIPSPAADSTVFLFASIASDRISLAARGLYLCAEEDGRITLSKPIRGDWEAFTIAYPNFSDVLESADLPVTMQRILSEGHAQHKVENKTFISIAGEDGKRAVITDMRWLETYIASEHFHFARLLHEKFGFDVIDPSFTDLTDPYCLEMLNSYDVIVILWPRWNKIPLHLVSAYKVVKIDDLENYDSYYGSLLKYYVRHCDLLIGPYAYDFPKWFPHRNIHWVPYTSSIEEDGGILPLNADPVCKVLLSGSVAADRPFRKFVFELEDDRLVKIGHPGYGGNYGVDSEELVKARWYKEIHKYLCAFCDAHSLRYIHLRVFEIASVGALLLADRLVEAEMNELGFIDRVTCIFCDASDFAEKVAWILDETNRETVDRIRAEGMKLCLSRHTTRRRVADFVTTLKFRTWGRERDRTAASK